MYNVEPRDGKQFGLRFIPSIWDNDADAFEEFMLTKKVIPEYSFSQRNQDLMMKILLELKPMSILEIGVDASNGSSTNVILSNKPSGSVYLGVDKANKNYLNRSEEGIHTIQTDSSNYEAIKSSLVSLGVESLDLFHIDGWHSVNQVLRDFRFASDIRVGGMVILHDTNVHPGPVALIKAIDPNIFKIEKYFEDLDDDWGMTILTRLC